ncbi:hypothetical protein RE6C_03181 [Rhodopirellula europaea 6C]|uniref:Uncharacterized protein n=1 Tax=Rhodopirellula europaea 6C TaxID=1263867 RepID=M2B2T7_9BACT|nr:hypothetical protein RE6C_03181 [Rhodopirellula europaea 6C]
MAKNGFLLLANRARISYFAALFATRTTLIGVVSGKSINASDQTFNLNILDFRSGNH